jgi:ABC-type multidrug transport system ATPase subunit
MLVHLLRLKGVSAPNGLKKLARELLDRVNLGFAGKRALKGYSGGMKQRLGVAQAIAGDPRLVIVDEPTAGLDPEERIRFYHLLAELAENRTVVLSTHIVEDVAVLCSQFAVIRDGRLIARTTPREAREAFTGTIFEGTVPPSELEALSRERHVTQAILVEGRHRVRVYDPERRPPAGFEPVAATLEDAYLALVRGLARLREPASPNSSPGASASAADGSRAPAVPATAGVGGR